jgi:hypothetical protein
MLDRTAEVKETKTRVAWTKAARRAIAGDLVRTLVRRGATVLVPSCSTDGRRYRVRLHGDRVGGCDCAAGLLGRPCRHRAAVVLRLYERETGVRVQWVKAVDPAVLGRYLAPAAPWTARVPVPGGALAPAA